MTMSSAAPTQRSPLEAVIASIRALDGTIVERSTYESLLAEYTALINDVQQSLRDLETFMPQKRMRAYRSTLTHLYRRIGVVEPAHTEVRNHRSHQRRERQDLRDTIYALNTGA